MVPMTISNSLSVNAGEIPRIAGRSYLLHFRAFRTYFASDSETGDITILTCLVWERRMYSMGPDLEDRV
jgi:hypothetical protein